MSCPSLNRDERLRVAARLDLLSRNAIADIAELSFVAEDVGQVVAHRHQYLEEIAVPVLLALLNHASPLVREGAIYGLADFASRRPEVARALMRLGWADPSPGVRDAANEALT